MKVMMLDIFGDSMPKRSFAKEDHAVEALVFDRTDKSFSEGIEVWTSRRQSKRFNSSGPHDHVESGGEFGVTVADQISAFGKQITPTAGEIAGGLPHPVIGRAIQRGRESLIRFSLD
jgi:hypothetical protein